MKNRHYNITENRVPHILSKVVIIFSFVLAFSTSGYAQQIHPTPQEIVKTDEFIHTPKSIQLISDKTSYQSYKDLTEALLNSSISSKGFQLIVGRKGDRSVHSFVKHIPQHTEAYYLSIDEKRIVIAGSDERGVHYGLQTLSQLIKADTIPFIQVKDWPDVPYRGVVEGFYGTPWSFDARLSQIKFYGKNKLNTYIYGPKDDPYHSSPHWRSPYPSTEANAIEALVASAKENNVNFVWAIHPGKDIKWNVEDKNNLIQKFNNMYELGVRSFAVFFDDISGEGTKADKQAELLNAVNREFIQVKKDVLPLIMCPTEYNKSWSNIEKGYLPTLGKKLDDDIHIMWTGDRVCIDIYQSSLDWINPFIERPAFIWWNFPVSDYVRDHLLMGKVYGNDQNISNKMSGFVCNPMERAEASKIAIYSVASYAWNMKAYDAQKAWEEGITELMPNDFEALKVFAQHNSDLGANGHQYRREESVHILPTLESASLSLKQSGKLKQEDINILYDEFSAVNDAMNILLASEDNKALIEEISPWIKQLKNTAETGIASLDLYKALQEKNKVLFNQKYKLIQALNKIKFSIDQKYNQNPYQPGVKTASLHLSPFIDKLFTLVVNQYNAEHNTDWDSQSFYSPFKMETSIAQFQHILLQVKKNLLIIPPINEIIRWKTDDYIELQSNDAHPFVAIKLNIESISTQWELMLSTNGKDWFIYNKPLAFGKRLHLDKPNIKYIKLINKGVESEVKFKRGEIEFSI